MSMDEIIRRKGRSKPVSYLFACLALMFLAIDPLAGCQGHPQPSVPLSSDELLIGQNQGVSALNVRTGTARSIVEPGALIQVPDGTGWPSRSYYGGSLAPDRQSFLTVEETEGISEHHHEAEGVTDYHPRVDKRQIQRIALPQGSLEANWGILGKPDDYDCPGDGYYQLGFVPGKDQIWILVSDRTTFVNLSGGRRDVSMNKVIGGVAGTRATIFPSHIAFSQDGKRVAYSATALFDNNSVSSILCLGRLSDDSFDPGKVLLQTGTSKDVSGSVIEGDFKGIAWLSTDRLAVLVAEGPQREGMLNPGEAAPTKHCSLWSVSFDSSGLIQAERRLLAAGPYVPERYGYPSAGEFYAGPTLSPDKMEIALFHYNEGAITLLLLDNQFRIEKEIPLASASPKDDSDFQNPTPWSPPISWGFPQ